MEDDNWGNHDGGDFGGGRGGPGGGPASNNLNSTSGYLIDQDKEADDDDKYPGGGRKLETGRGMLFRCRRHASTLAFALLAMVSLTSPVLMVVLPSLPGVLDLRQSQLVCGVDCDGLLVALAFKLFILAAGTWAVFAKRPRAALPRVRMLRVAVSALAAVFVAAFWLFYLQHVVRERELVTYKALAGFASDLVDCLLFVHYLAVLLLELRHRVHQQYYIKVVRSPDGESRGFPSGAASVQDAASHVLDRYYSDFPAYNPYLDRVLHPAGSANGAAVRGSRRGVVKVYDIDGPAAAGANDGNSTVVSVASRGRGADARMALEEFDHERKVKKRRLRLVAAAEEAFTHIRRLRANHAQSPTEKSPMEPYEAAQAIFPTLSRPLQKYLRATRQQPRHTVDSILDHLSSCLSFDLSPRAFLERYLCDPRVLNGDPLRPRDSHHWSLVSERSLYRDLAPGTRFQLRQGEVSLLCQVQELPHFVVSEEIVAPRSNRFVLRVNSETSV